MTLRRVLVELSVVEQRYRAVLEVLAGSSKTAVAQRFGVSRQAVHRWLVWYAESGLAGLADRSHRPESHPLQTPAEVWRRRSVSCVVRIRGGDHGGWNMSSYLGHPQNSTPRRMLTRTHSYFRFSRSFPLATSVLTNDRTSPASK